MYVFIIKSCVGLYSLLLFQKYYKQLFGKLFHIYTLKVVERMAVMIQYVLFMVACINPNLVMNQPYLCRTCWMTGSVIKKYFI
jgi:hypothetical protein